MALVTLKLSDLDLVYAQLNALRRHVGLFPLNPKEYVISVDGVMFTCTNKYVSPAKSQGVSMSSSVALVVPIVPPEEYSDNEEDDESTDEAAPSQMPSRIPKLKVKPQDVSSHSWVSGF